MRKLYFLFLILSIVLSCSEKGKLPADILPQPKMEAVMWDMISAGEFLNGYIFNRDTADRKKESVSAYGKVFRIHAITREQFEKSYQYYREHPVLMKVILDSLSSKKKNFGQRLPATDSLPIKMSPVPIQKDDSLSPKIRKSL
jgi:hypothetical protein